ncbi:MAG TPA: MBL fold metallo-hydrolase [Methanothrix soehngenii]|nr:MBL fold metallo-hydrolase [Methanothrix soehngenii]
MKTTLLGTGVGIPQPDRSQSALLIREDDISLLIDCGAGTLLRLSQADVMPQDLQAVLLTHLHPDHSADLLLLANACYLQGEDMPPVFGPVGTERFVKAMQAIYPYLAPLRIVVRELVAEEGTAVEAIEITTAEAVHSVAALCYRIDSSASLVCSGDTEPTMNVAELAEGADLLIHECSFPEGISVTNHSTPLGIVPAAQVVKHVVLTHFYPDCRGLEDAMARQLEDASGTFAQAARDGLQLEIG